MAGDSFRRTHWRHVFIVGLLVFTGLGLYLPTWRSGLGPVLPYVQWVHEFGGLLYGIALLGLTWWLFPRKPGKPDPGFAKTALAFLVILSVSGAGLIVGPSWTRAIATVFHAGSAAAFVAWVVWHLLTQHPLRFRHDIRRIPRRTFLRWLGAAAVTVPAALAAPTMMRQVGGALFGRAGGQVQGALPGFVPYTVVGGYPEIKQSAWRLRLTGLSAQPQDFSYSAWLQQPSVERTINFQCVTGWSVQGVRFRGVDLHDFLTRQGWDPKKHPWVTFFSGDGVYTDSLNAKEILKYKPLVAYRIDGKPLPRSQGAPVRLIVPNMYGYKSVKWLVGIHAGSTKTTGYWEQRGYPADAYIGSYPSLLLKVHHPS